MGDKKEITEDLITQAVVSVKSQLNIDSEEVEFWQLQEDCRTIQKGGKKLTPLHDNDIQNYANKYLQFFTSLGIPTVEIVIQDCAVRVNTFGSYDIFSFKGCKIELLTKQSSMLQLENCDVEKPFDWALVLRRCYKTIFRESVIINTNSQSKIENSVFLKKLHAQNTFIKNCKIEFLSASQNIEIENCLIERAHLNSLHNLSIKRSTLKLSDINNCQFGTAASFTNVTFETSPTIHNIEFSSKNIHFGNPTFKDISTDKALGSFRQLKYLCEDAGYEAGAILFHAYELETYYNIYLKQNCPSALWPEKISSWFHHEFTDYGRNIMRPFYFLGLIFVIGACWNFIGSYNFLQLGNTFHKAFFWSLRNSLGPLFFALPSNLREMQAPSKIAGFIAFFQLVFSSVLWFLIVFMIRRRFKL